MASVIRSPQVGEPRRIVTPGQPAPKVEAVAGVPESHIAAEAGSLGQEAQRAADELNPVDEKILQNALEDYKRGFEAELQIAADRAESAEQRLRKLEAELELLRENATLAGHEEGMRKGQEEGRAALEELARSLNSVISSLNDERVRLLEEKEDRLVEIVYAAVTRILGESLLTEIGVRQAVLQVLRHVSQRDPMLLRVAPHDHAVISTLSTELTEAGATVEFISDERVETGGCILETTGGSLDGRLEVQLHNLKAALLSARARRRAESEGVGG